MPSGGMARLRNPHVDGELEEERWAKPASLAACFLASRPSPRAPRSPAPAKAVSLTRLVAWARRLGECSAKTAADEADATPVVPAAPVRAIAESTRQLARPDAPRLSVFPRCL